MIPANGVVEVIASVVDFNSEFDRLSDGKHYQV